MKIPIEFYLQANVVEISKQLLGKVLCTNIGGNLTKGIISETEAYNGEIDKASHSYGGKRTKRTEIMYAQGGVSYVYLCYGIHSLFNVVTNLKEIPEAVLIRAIIPIEGISIQHERRKIETIKKDSFTGPGKVCQALGINTGLNKQSLIGTTIWIEDLGILVDKEKIIAGPRIGVEYAKEDALLPYRFQYLEFNPTV